MRIIDTDCALMIAMSVHVIFMIIYMSAIVRVARGVGILGHLE